MQNNQQPPYQPLPRRKTWVVVLSTILIALGAIVCFFSAMLLIVVVAMPNSIGAYYIMSFFEVFLSSPFVSLIIGVVFIVVGIVLSRLRTKQ